MHLIRDAGRSSITVGDVANVSIGIRDRPTSPPSPWQNAYAERLIGSIRRECLDHIVVFGERHLAPKSRAAETVGRILCRPILGGLHHQYARI
jgi:hypothetical protein